MKVKIEGNTVELPDEICKTNKGITDALLPFYPGVANAEFKRDEKAGTITVNKKAGKKGNLAPLIAALDAAPESINPVLLLEALPPKQIPEAQLDEAITRSIADQLVLDRIVETLTKDAEPQSARSSAPVGF